MRQSNIIITNVIMIILVFIIVIIHVVVDKWQTTFIQVVRTDTRF